MDYWWEIVLIRSRITSVHAEPSQYSALIDGAIDYLRSKNAACIKLDATPEGAQVYEQLSFRPELELFRCEGDLKSNGDSVETDDLALPFDFDCKAFGAGA